MKPPLITNMMQRKDISKYIYKYFIEKDEKDNFVKGIVKWEHKLDTELDGSMLFNDIYRITNRNKNGTISCKELSSEKIPKTVSFGDSSKTSKSKADESQILNEVQNLFATGQSHR
jgi:hypothetical protein